MKKVFGEEIEKRFLCLTLGLSLSLFTSFVFVPADAYCQQCNSFSALWISPINLRMNWLYISVGLAGPHWFSFDCAMRHQPVMALWCQMWKFGVFRCGLGTTNRNKHRCGQEEKTFQVCLLAITFESQRWKAGSLCSWVWARSFPALGSSSWIQLIFWKASSSECFSSKHSPCSADSVKRRQRTATSAPFAGPKAPLLARGEASKESLFTSVSWILCNPGGLSFTVMSVWLVSWQLFYRVVFKRWTILGEVQGSDHKLIGNRLLQPEVWALTCQSLDLSLVLWLDYFIGLFPRRALMCL